MMTDVERSFFLIELNMSSSVSASRLDVASSKIRSSGIIMTALAMAILCFCPPDNVIPRSPTIVSYLSGRLSIKSSIWAIFAASTTS